jgi:hypothetical protein
MFEALQRIFAGQSQWEIARDFLDIAIVAYLIYRLLLIVRGTRAMQMGVGLGVILLLYLGSKSAGLVTLQSLLQYVLSSIILIVVVVFQNDIRRALIRVGGQALARTRTPTGAVKRDRRGRRRGDRARPPPHRRDHRVRAGREPARVHQTRGDGHRRRGHARAARRRCSTPSRSTSSTTARSSSGTQDRSARGCSSRCPRAGCSTRAWARGTAPRSGSRRRPTRSWSSSAKSEARSASASTATSSSNLDGTALRQTLSGLLEQKPAKPGGRAPASGSTKPQKETRVDSTPVLTPPPASVPPPAPVALQTPIPAARPAPAQTSRLERARAEAARSAEPEAPRAKKVSQPMPRSASSGPAGDGGVSEPVPPSSDRPSFVPSSRPPLDDGSEVISPRGEDG